MSEQNYSNHAKVVKPFVFFVVPVLVLNLTWTIHSLVRFIVHNTITPSQISRMILEVLVSAALLVLAFLARTFALGVQDRVIRLEERLRYERLLSEDLKARIGEFTINQIVSLRFASDGELPALARKVLDEKLNDRKTIKRMVHNWRPDYQRV